LVCAACGRTEEFDSAQVLQAGADAAAKHGFRLLSSRLTVRGLCGACAAAV
jgi:Fur family ferric uptake transcriptional regulator